VQYSAVTGVAQFPWPQSAFDAKRASVASL
jgi:hypothetical protein